MMTLSFRSTSERPPRGFASASWVGRGLLAAAILASAGCNDVPARNPVPEAELETARVPGYDLIRFWGDRDTNAFDDAMKQQFSELKAAAKNGKLPDADRRANILAISGGGDQGAFAAGYLTGWSERGTRPSFNVVTGVSTGALAAPFAFLGATHDDALRDIYTRNGADQLYEMRWDLGVFSNALKDTKPLRDMIGHVANDALLDKIAAQYRLGRRLLVSTTNLDAERPVIWDLSAIAASGRPDRGQLFTDILLASSAVPGVFPPVKIKVTTEDGAVHDELHADGSVAMQMFFLPPGIKLTETETAIFGKPRERALYVLRNGKLAPEYAQTAERAADLLQRGVHTLVKYQVVYNLRLIEKAARDSDTRFKFMGIPKAFDDVPAGKFDRAYAEKLFESGRVSGFKQEWVDTVPETPVLMPDSATPAQRASR